MFFQKFNLKRSANVQGAVASSSISNSNNSNNSNPFGEEDEDGDDGTRDDEVIEKRQGKAVLNNSISNGNHEAKELSSDSDDDTENSAEKSPETYLNIKVKALYNYKRMEDDELSLTAGNLFFLF